MTAKQFLRRLEAAGCVVVKGRGKGGHVLVRLGTRQTTVPYHGADIGPIFRKMICKQLGLDPEKVL